MKSQGMTKVRTSNPEETLQKLVVNHSARGKKKHCTLLQHAVHTLDSSQYSIGRKIITQKTAKNIGV